MSDEPADIYTQLKRSHLRGTGLRLTNRQVRELYERTEEDAAQVAREVAEYLFTNGAGQKARRLVIELEDGHESGGWCKQAVADTVRRILKGELKQ